MEQKEDGLGILAALMLEDLFEMFKEQSGEQLSQPDFAERYITPTMRRGRPSSEDLLQEYAITLRDTKDRYGKEARLCMIRITSALTAEALAARLRKDREASWESLANAQFWLGMLCGMPEGSRRVDAQSFAREGAMARYARDPKQKEKAFVRQCWSDWQRKPSCYASKAAFARDMLTKCEHLTSQKQIEDWCREWEKNERSFASMVSPLPGD
ncbi:hypothetical protein [Caballeronia sp. BCC1704]|uniref:hypothetical protein n=1 Tax=Caballeronia sp. BCC1704 TaxID=2676300 RepID=UPI001589D479|nr:hypothetical protein [Caballeronia sp. BCC1704]